ncbi:unnamed protein product, partial [Mycena citricolor]
IRHLFLLLPLQLRACPCLKWYQDPLSVSTSTGARPTASSATDLRVYYCICGEFIVRVVISISTRRAEYLISHPHCPNRQLVIDKSLASLPRRPTDGAIIIRAQDNGDDEKARVFKLNAVVGDPILVERTGGHECQYRFTCPRCTLPIGYQATPPPMKSGPYVYLLSGALSQVQGQVPADAFEGDEQGESNK